MPKEIQKETLIKWFLLANILFSLVVTLYAIALPWAPASCWEG